MESLCKEARKYPIVSQIFSTVAATAYFAEKSGIPQVAYASIKTLCTGREPSKVERKWDKMSLKQKIVRGVVFTGSMFMGALTAISIGEELMSTPQPQPKESNGQQSTTRQKRSMPHHIGKRNVPTTCGPGDLFRVTDGLGNNLIRVTNNSVSLMNGEFKATQTSILMNLNGRLPVTLTNEEFTVGVRGVTTQFVVSPTTPGGNTWMQRAYYENGILYQNLPSCDCP